MITYWGYPVEEHLVTTDDGYVLTMHRIPFGKDGLTNQTSRCDVTKHWYSSHYIHILLDGDIIYLLPGLQFSWVIVSCAQVRSFPLDHQKGTLPT